MGWRESFPDGYRTVDELGENLETAAKAICKILRTDFGLYRPKNMASYYLNLRRIGEEALREIGYAKEWDDE